MNTCQYPECESSTENENLDYCGTHGTLTRKMERQAIKDEQKKAVQLDKQKAKAAIQKSHTALKKHSEQTHYTTSDTGERVSRAEAEIRIRKTKAEFLADFMNKHGYYFCEDCGTTCDYLDCSHNKSINECIQNGMIELSWWIGNFALRCRSKCHPKKDNSGLQWTSLKS